MTVNQASHWDDRYRSVGAQSVSWYQNRPTMSLELLAEAGATAASSVIDVGGGASNLVDHLLAAGTSDLAVLDLSATALAEARGRIGDATSVTWLVADVLAWEPDRRRDLWHDRAVLHFLLSDEDRARYVSTMRRALVTGGVAVIGGFAEDGPTECSALPVRRSSPPELRELFCDSAVIAERREVHTTPSGALQPFNWIAVQFP